MQRSRIADVARYYSQAIQSTPGVGLRFSFIGNLNRPIYTRHMCESAGRQPAQCVVEEGSRRQPHGRVIFERRPDLLIVPAAPAAPRPTERQGFLRGSDAVDSADTGSRPILILAVVQ